MRERPILFSGPMVRAILAGTKTQTRRIVKPQPAMYEPGQCTDVSDMIADALICPYGKPGDRLWVRENGWERPERTPKMMRDGADTWAPYYYDADGWSEQDHADLKAWGFKRRPSIHMPRSACRLVLEISGVRVERLQDISEADILAEGVTVDRVAEWCNTPWSHMPTLHHAWRVLWESINGAGAWDANPWVWVVEFRPVAARQQQEGGGDG